MIVLISSRFPWGVSNLVFNAHSTRTIISGRNFHGKNSYHSRDTNLSHRNRHALRWWKFCRILVNVFQLPWVFEVRAHAVARWTLFCCYCFILLFSCVCVRACVFIVCVLACTCVRACMFCLLLLFWGAWRSHPKAHSKPRFPAPSSETCERSH